MHAFKKAKPLENEEEKKAKMGVLGDLKKSMRDEQNSKLDGVKKVSVMSNSEKGLEKGLDKAKDIIHGHVPEMEETRDPEAEMSNDDEEMEERMHPEMHKDILAECSPEEIAQMIEMIKAKKARI